MTRLGLHLISPESLQSRRNYGQPFARHPVINAFPWGLVGRLWRSPRSPLKAIIGHSHRQNKNNRQVLSGTPVSDVFATFYFTVRGLISERP